jgi:hypothetical protein
MLLDRSRLFLKIMGYKSAFLRYEPKIRCGGLKTGNVFLNSLLCDNFFNKLYVGATPEEEV